MATSPRTTAAQSLPTILGSSSVPQEKSSLLAQIGAKLDSSNFLEAAKDFQSHLGSLEGIKPPELVETYRLARPLLPYLFDILRQILKGS